MSTGRYAECYKLGLSSLLHGQQTAALAVVGAPHPREEGFRTV